MAYSQSSAQPHEPAGCAHLERCRHFLDRAGPLLLFIVVGIAHRVIMKVWRGPADAATNKGKPCLTFSRKICDVKVQEVCRCQKAVPFAEMRRDAESRVSTRAIS